MALTVKDIQIIRMIVREEVSRSAGSLAISATAQPEPHMKYQVVPQQVYIVGTHPFQQSMNEAEYNQYLSNLTLEKDSGLALDKENK
jgi:hypothetical protein